VSVVCVYAFVSRSDRRPGVVGLEGERLRRVRAGGVDVMVGSLSRRPAPRTATLRRYDAIERALGARHPAVLPARFGTCVADPADLVLLIRSQAAPIRKALRLVRHRVQMTTRLFADKGQTGVGPGSDRGQTRVRSGSDHEYGATQGTEYLRTRAADARRQRELPEFAPLGAAVRRWVKAERMERQDRGRLIGSVYHLIPRGVVSAYQRSLERAALDAGRTTIVSGPWPAYAFAPGLDD